MTWAEVAAAFRAPRRIDVSGDWLVVPTEANAAELAAWNRLNPGREVAAPGEYTVLMWAPADGEPVTYMSDAEWRDHLAILRRARGRVLVTGLGLGCVVRALFATGRVDHVTVVEREPDVVALVWPELLAAYGDRVTLHQACALTGPMPAGRWDWCWHDIWPTVALDNVPEMFRLRRRYRNRVPRGRQLCWAEGLLWWNARALARDRLLRVMANRERGLRMAEEFAGIFARALRPLEELTGDELAEAAELRGVAL